MPGRTPSTVLAIHDVPPLEPGSRGIVLALHDHGRDIDQLVPFWHAAAPRFRLIAVEGPQPVTAYTIDDAGYFEGYAWYPGDGAEVTELARFGHALACLEELVIDLRRDAAGTPLVLLGHAAGAVVALTMAAVMPDRLDAVISICGALPRAAGWSVPATELAGLPVLMLCDDQDPPPLAAEGAEAVSVLRRQGAQVFDVSVTGSRREPLVGAGIVATWLKTDFSSRSAPDLARYP